MKDLIADRPLVQPFKKQDLSNIIAEVFNNFQVTETSKMLDRMKNLGYKYSTRSGITVGIADVSVLEAKPEILKEAHAKVDKINATHRRGLITEEERYDNVIDVWQKAKDEIQDALMDSLDPRNNIFMMSDSGARGNISNFTQLAGMRAVSYTHLTLPTIYSV